MYHNFLTYDIIITSTGSNTHKSKCRVTYKESLRCISLIKNSMTCMLMISITYRRSRSKMHTIAFSTSSITGTMMSSGVNFLLNAAMMTSLMADFLMNSSMIELRGTFFDDGYADELDSVNEFHLFNLSIISSNECHPSIQINKHVHEPLCTSAPRRHTIQRQLVDE